MLRLCLNHSIVSNISQNENCNIWGFFFWQYNPFLLEPCKHPLPNYQLLALPLYTYIIYMAERDVASPHPEQT